MHIDNLENVTYLSFLVYSLLTDSTSLILVFFPNVLL
jgi:hypothetical protein